VEKVGTEPEVRVVREPSLWGTQQRIPNRRARDPRRCDMGEKKPRLEAGGGTEIKETAPGTDVRNGSKGDYFRQGRRGGEAWRVLRAFFQPQCALGIYLKC